MLVKDRKGRHLRQTLENIDVAEIGYDQGSVSGAEERLDRGGIKQLPADIDFAVQFSRDAIDVSRRKSSCNRSGAGINSAGRFP